MSAAVGTVHSLGVIQMWRSVGRGHGLSVWRAACFLGGIGILAIALSPPMDELADRAFSMYMLQHMLLNADQQLAGMIMWLPGGILFGLLMVFYFGGWLRAIETRMQVTRPEFARIAPNARTGDSNE